MNVLEEKKNVRVACYARVSTSDKSQNPELQLNPIKEYCQARGWSIASEYVDVGQSGAKDRRPQLDRLLNDARKRKIDCIVVWKLDRWARNLKHLINSLSELQELGVSFVSYQENIDLSTPAGKMMFHIIGAMAEFERSLIQERVKAGMAVAKLKGIQIGRKPTDAIFLAQIIEAHENESLSVREIAAKVKIPRSTVFRTIKQFKAGELGRDGQIITAE
ncbi:MAG TPA: recombinase family protein [Nitrospirota bacterium]|nr:recombinase family protein [Nitrospirota bacterium]